MKKSTEPVRVLIVLGGLDRGGAQSVVMNYYYFMDKSKVQFDFITHCLEKGELEDEIEKLGGRVFHFPRFKVYNIFEYVKSWKEFLADHHDYVAIHAHMASTACLFIPMAKKYGIKTIAHAHTSRDVGNTIKKGLERFSFLLVDYMADYFFGCSKEAAVFRFGKNILKNSKYEIWYNAIDLTKFQFSYQKRCEIRNLLNIKPDELVIGNVGRLSYPKNHDFLLKVYKEYLKQNSLSRLLLVGSGDMEQQIINNVHLMGLAPHVIFTGSVENVQDYLAAMDIFVFPSHWEGLPVSVVEAQASGLYCLISSNVTREVSVSHNIEFDDLSKGVDFWVSRITDAPRVNRASFILKNSNYDIKKAAKKAEQFYLSLKK